uniref:Uncharacterized protein n=1 Tax=uncultured marine virus TaxID=186617 RepID=A0A0F7L3Z3_9VIRU|nr:hypothetical protein [uncultured marine virus]
MCSHEYFHFFTTLTIQLPYKSASLVNSIAASRYLALSSTVPHIFESTSSHNQYG